MIYQDDYPWDVRVEKMCTAFVDNKNKVNLIAKNYNHSVCTEIIKKNFEINRLRCYKNKYINCLFNFPAFFSPAWIIKIYQVAKNNSTELIIVRDLPLALSAILVGKVLKIPVAMDMAENYPEMIRDTWKYGKISKFDFLIRNPFLLKYLELLALRYLDGVYVVSEESKKRLLTLNVKEEKIFVVGNTPIINEYVNIKTLFEEVRLLSKFNILYVGGLEECRGLDIVIRAIPEILSFINDFAIVIVGDGASLEYLKRLSVNLNVKERVFFLGWKSHDLIPSIINACDVCVVPHYVTNHTNTTLPNKIYDYMMHGKPVLVSSSKSLVNVVISTKCGYVFEDRNVKSFSENILLLFNCKDRENMGNNGKKAVVEILNWGVDSGILIKSLNNYLNV